MAKFELAGTFTALVTPFSADGQAIDWSAYEALVESQLAGGINGLVPCGTTGETPTLSDAEQVELVKRTRDLVAGRASVLVGTGSNSTAKTIAASRAAVEAGADAVMIVNPYYNKPSQDGLVRHIQLVSEAVSVPIVLYNIPGRCAVEMTVDSIMRVLDSCSNVIGMKDATGNVLACQELVRRAGTRVAVMSGDDGLALPMISVGAKGLISVSANVMPSPVTDMVRAALAGDFETARALHLKLLPLHASMFAEPNPAPAKAVLHARGMMQASVRPPLVPASESALKLVQQALAGL